MFPRYINKKRNYDGLLSGVIKVPSIGQVPERSGTSYKGRYCGINLIKSLKLKLYIEPGKM